MGVRFCCCRITFGTFINPSGRKKAIAGTDNYVRTLSQTVSSPEDTAHHFLVQQVIVHETRSTDPDFDKVTATVYEQTDSVRDKGTHRGYRIQCHANGDKTFVKYHGTHQLAKNQERPHKVHIEGVWEFTGGTGRFSEIKGGGNYSGMETPEGLVLKWKGEVEY